MAKSLIDSALQGIAAHYTPGSLARMKRARSASWAQLLSLEGRINAAALAGDPRALKIALTGYRKLILSSAA